MSDKTSEQESVSSNEGELHLPDGFWDDDAEEQSEKKIELKECPFCGSKEVDTFFQRDHYDGFHFVGCCSCDARGPSSYEKAKDAGEAWNRRTSETKVFSKNAETSSFVQKTKEKFKAVISITIILMFMTICLFMGTDSVEIMPAHALVFLDEEHMEYYAPPYVIDILEPALNELDKQDKDVQDFFLKKMIFDLGYIPMIAEEARERGAKPNPACREQGYFVGVKRSAFTGFLADKGLWFKASRWTEDGDWLW